MAGAQVVAACWMLAPELITSLTGRVATEAKIQQPILSMVTSRVPDGAATTKNEQIEKTNILHPAISSQEGFMEKEGLAKTISSQVDPPLQTGDHLSIISIQSTPGADGTQTLKIAIKAQAHEVIAVSEVKVQVYFYDQIAGEVVVSKSPATSRWLNAVIDWKNGDPQLLEVTYQPSSNNPDAKYLGYVVAVYYEGTLQSYRADPTSITNEFPIKVYTGRDEF